MKVLFFETTNVTPHFETSLELAKKHVDQGDIVRYYFLGHSVPFAEMLERPLPLFSMSHPVKKAVNILGWQIDFIQPKISRKNLGSELGISFRTLEELKSIKYYNYNVGLSTLSSLISHTRNSEPNIEEHRNLIGKILLSGISIYEYVLREIDSQKPDLIYLFNGRFAVNRAIMDACIQKRIPFRVHERGANKNRYTANAWMPHDFSQIRKEMINSWHKADKIARVEIGQKYFHNRRGGKEDAWLSFLNKQKSNHLPQFPFEKKIIAYFSSSDDEYAAVGDIIKWKRWKNQLTAIKDLIDIISNHHELHLIIRLHPHKSKKHYSDLKKWLSLPLPNNATLLTPNSSVDSYALMERADVVVSSGSTTGIEAVYWGTPSICLGPSIYSSLSAVYLPKNKEELGKLLLTNSLHAESDKALAYGYYMATFGEEFQYYKPDSLFSGKFMGTNMQSPRYSKIIYKVTSFLRSL